MAKEKKKSKWLLYLIIFIIFIMVIRCNKDDDIPVYDEKTFYIISSSENKLLDESLTKFAKSKGYDIKITYDDTLEIVNRLNNGEKYDAVFISNSIWLSMLDSSKVKTSLLRSTSITPVIFGIKNFETFL